MTTGSQPTAIMPVMATETKKKKNPAAVSLGRKRFATADPTQWQEMTSRGGTIGGAARAASLSARRRKEIAKAAAAARWGKKAK